MSYSLKDLKFPPISTLRLPLKLSPSFKDGEQEQHDKDWAPLEAYGIQPNGDGVQVYAQPQTAEQIVRLARALELVAARMPQQKRRRFIAARHTSCKHCKLDIEGFAPYRSGEWRDRGNNTTCPHGPNAGKKHAPYRG